jgi:hypothetical protein
LVDDSSSWYQLPNVLYLILRQKKALPLALHKTPPQKVVNEKDMTTKVPE